MNSRNSGPDKDISSRMSKQPLFPCAVIFVCVLYLRICKCFLHFCPPQQLLRLVFAPLEAGICCWRSFVFAPFCLSGFCHFGATKGSVPRWYCIWTWFHKWHVLLQLISFLLHKFNLNSDFALVFISIPLFLPRLSYLSLNFSSISIREFVFVICIWVYISQHSSVFAPLIVFRPFCHWISPLLSLTSRLSTAFIVPNFNLWFSTIAL